MRQGLKNWLLLLFLSCIWGSSFILMKRGMIHKETGSLIFDNNQVAAIRMLLAAVVLLPFGIVYARKTLTINNILPLMAVGFLGNFFPAFLFTYAETGINSGLAGMLNSSTPVFTLIIGAVFFRQSLLLLQVLGVLIGTGGIIWLVTSSDSIGSSSPSYVIAVLLATLCYASSVNIIKFKLQGIAPLKITAIAFMLTLLPSLIVFKLTNTTTTFIENEYAWHGFSYLIVLGIVGTAFSVIVFNQLIANSSPLFASSVTYFIPIVAAGIGFMDGETLTFYQLLAMLTILGGVFIANSIKKRKKNIKP